jgi:hypothetical protein
LLARGNIANPDGNGKTAFISADNYLEVVPADRRYTNPITLL